MIMDLTKRRDDFPITKDVTYLATCNIAQFPRPVIEAIKNHVDSMQTFGILSSFEEGKQLAATLFGAKKEEIAYIRCTNEGINIVANMLDWKKGDNVVLSDLGFPSNIFPWQRQQSRGVEIRCVRSSGEGVWLSDIEPAVDDHTKVIALDCPSSANGFKCDLDALGDLARKHGAYLVVDGIQGLGAIPINLNRSKVDFFIAAGHKWLLGPTGIGLLYVREEHLEKFEPVYVGYANEEKTDFTYHEYKLTSTAKRFEFGGSPNMIGVIGLTAALKYIHSIGVQNIEQWATQLTDRAIKELESIEDIELPPWTYDRKYRSHWIGFKLRKTSMTQVVEALTKKKIIVAPKVSSLGETIRVAPHIMNIEEEIMKFSETLKQSIK